MRFLLTLLMFIGLTWLINAFYTVTMKKMANSRERENRSSSPKRKKVDSRVIEKENFSSYDKDKQ